MPMTVLDHDFEDVIAEALAAASRAFEVKMTVGITGSRDIDSLSQYASLSNFLTGIFSMKEPVELHHGCAVGVDENTHQLALYYPDVVKIHGHPGIDSKGKSPYRMQNMDGFAVLYPEELYGRRNLAIVKASRFLVACPKYPENDVRSQRSGTWQTVRFARRSRTPTLVVQSDGRIVPDKGVTR